MNKKLAVCAGLLALVSPFAQADKPADPPPSGFLCCNLRSDGSWIGDSNDFEDGQAIIPFGTPIRGLVLQE